MQENNIVDAEFEEIDDNVQAEENEEVSTTAPKMSKSEIIKALSLAVDRGHIGQGQLTKMRTEMGIFQSDFTRKKVSDSKRKSKRKAQKQARKKQRK